MSNEVQRGYSIYTTELLSNEIFPAINGAQTTANSADGKADQALSDAAAASGAAQDAAEAAGSADVKADQFDHNRVNDIEALLQSLIVEVNPPENEFVLGDEKGYYKLDSASGEYRVIQYGEGENLDDNEADATKLELIKRDNDTEYLLLEDEAESLFIFNHSTGAREPINDVFNGSNNDRETIKNAAFDGSKDEAHYLVKITYAPSSNDEIRRVHLRNARVTNEFLEREDNSNDRLESVESNNTNRRTLRLIEIQQD